MFAELLLEMVWEEGSWEVFVDNKSPRIIVKVEFMDQSLKMNENPSIFFDMEKTKTKMVLIIKLYYELVVGTSDKTTV